VIKGRVFVGKSGRYSAYLFYQTFLDFSVVEARVELQKPLQKAEVVAALGPKPFGDEINRELVAGAIEILRLSCFVEEVAQPLDYLADYMACLGKLETTILGSAYVN